MRRTAARSGWIFLSVRIPACASLERIANKAKLSWTRSWPTGADDLIVDLLFAANGETYETVQPFVRELTVEGVPVRVLNIDGLLRTKTRTREKDLLDRSMLERIRQGLGGVA